MIYNNFTFVHSKFNKSENWGPIEITCNTEGFQSSGCDATSMGSSSRVEWLKKNANMRYGYTGKNGRVSGSMEMTASQV